MYKNDFNYDIINYEQLIYIEQYFSENEKITEQLSRLKNIIAENFVAKNKYFQRLLKLDTVNIDYNTRPQSITSEIHLPEEYTDMFHKIKEMQYEYSN
jgi:hypothetical protein